MGFSNHFQVKIITPNNFTAVKKVENRKIRVDPI